MKILHLMRNFSTNMIKSNSLPYQVKLNQFSKRMGRAQSKAKKRSGRIPGSCSHLCVGRNEEFISHHETHGGVRSKLSGKFFKKIVSCHSGEQHRWKKRKWFYWTKTIVKVQQKENEVYCGADGRDESLALLKIHKQFYFLNEYHAVCFGRLSSRS